MNYNTLVQLVQLVESNGVCYEVYTFRKFFHLYVDGLYIGEYATSNDALEYAVDLMIHNTLKPRCQSKYCTESSYFADDHGDVYCAQHFPRD